LVIAGLKTRFAGRNESARWAEFVAEFRCRDYELEALADVMSDAGLRELTMTLRRIRAAPVHLRPTLAMAIPFVLSNDNLPSDKSAWALAAFNAIVERFPPST
jgi:hypothetical protein